MKFENDHLSMLQNRQNQRQQQMSSKHMQKSRTMASFEIKASIKAVKIQLDDKNKDIDRETNIKSQTGSLNLELSGSKTNKRTSS